MIIKDNIKEDPCINNNTNNLNDLINEEDVKEIKYLLLIIIFLYKIKFYCRQKTMKVCIS